MTRFQKKLGKRKGLANKAAKRIKSQREWMAKPTQADLVEGRDIIKSIDAKTVTARVAGTFDGYVCPIPRSRDVAMEFNNRDY